MLEALVVPSPLVDAVRLCEELGFGPRAATIDIRLPSCAPIPANRYSISALDMDSEETCLGVRFVDSVIGCDPEGTVPDERSTFSESVPAPAKAGLG